MVPEGWLHTTFDKHIECLTGFAFKSSGYSSEENSYKLLRGDNIEPGKLRWVESKYWPKEQSKNLGRYQLQVGDFVIALDRTWISAGIKIAEIKPEDTPCLLVQRVARVRAKPTLEQTLLRQYFSGHKFEQYVKSVQTATAVPHISPSDIKDYPLLLPPIEEQKKIAQILSTWDKAIATTEKLLEQSQKQKQALMQQLLTGKKRFPEFSGEWKTSKVQNLVTISKGKQLNRDGLIESDIYPVINGGISPSGYTDKPNTKANTITISEGGNSCGYVALQKSDFWCGGHCYALKTPKLPLLFLYQLLKFNETKIMRLRVGSGLPNIQKKDLDSLHLTYPADTEEQMKIANVLSTADENINSLKKKLDSLMKEKKALMQQLLTGKKRVKLES